MSTGKLTLTQIAGSSSIFYEQCYVFCQPDVNGCISAMKAADFLKTSGLSDKILSEIWECSDSSSKGYLTKHEFHVALKLVALAQNKIDPKMHNLVLSVSNPHLTAISPSQCVSNSCLSPIDIWAISTDEQSKYSKVFDSLESPGGKLSGDAVKPVFINSKLPVSILGQVWTLSDIDKDGSLDRDEFILAMHLIYKCLAGEEPFKTLPPSLIPPSKRRPPSLNSVQSSFRGITSANASFLNSSLRLPSSDWVVGKLEKERYDSQFYIADKDKDGLVSGLDIKDSFVQSGLPQNILAQIWDLCDVVKSGMLNSEQFALAMHLINDQISSACTKPLPTTLSTEMMPPSLRRKSIDASNAETLTLNSFGLKTDSDDVYRDIDVLKKERTQVEQVIRQCETDFKCQAQEMQEMQETLDSAALTAQTLAKQREEAQHRLDELSEQRHKTQVLLDETRVKCREERELLEALRQQIGSQSASIEEKKDELRRLQGELNDLIREEASLQEQVQRHQARLVAIEQETSSTETHVADVEYKNKGLEGLRCRLQEVLAEYEAVLASQGSVDVTKVPDEAIVDALLAPSVLEHTSRTTNQWPDDDPFTKDDPFSSIADPFASAGPHSDPFSSVNDPFSSSSLGQDPFASPSIQDPFTSSKHDPFSLNNGWCSSTSPPAPTRNHQKNSNDQNHAFSIGAVDDLFKNMDMNNTSANHNQYHSNNDPFGFGDSAFEEAPGKILPPPRPTKAPQALGSLTKAGKQPKIDVRLSETDQLSWAKGESEREAREAEAVRKREQADFEMALKLSQAEYKSQERRKGHKSGKK